MEYVGYLYFEYPAGLRHPKIDCCTQLFKEISTDNVKCYKVTCYQDLIDAMTSAK